MNGKLASSLVAFAVALAGAFHVAARGAPRPATLEVDGNWSAVAIDGRPAPVGYRLAIENGRVQGGRDACNDWGYQEDGRGGRLIVSTLVGCPEEDPVRRAFWVMASATDASIALQGDGTLRVAAGGHEAVWQRCRWTRPSPRQSARCVVE